MGFLIFLHVGVCLALIMIVLLQTGKGADMGAAFGGGSSQTLFGSAGASTFLGKATTIVAIVFMCTCLLMAYYSTGQTGSSVMSQEAVTTEEKAVPDAVKTEAPAAAETTPAVTETKPATSEEASVTEAAPATEAASESTAAEPKPSAAEPQTPKPE